MSASLSPKLNAVLELAEMKRIYSAIETSLLKNTPAVLAVTSAVHGEGKTMAAAGLAATAAKNSDKRILAVDMNWHDPSLHTYFGLDAVDGKKISNGFLLEDIAQNSGLPNLDVLTAIQTNTNGGKPVSDEFSLATKILKKARDAYDITIVDTSKMFPTNRRMLDPVDIAKHADGVALVVFANMTPRQQVKRAKILLETSGANVIGLIYNQINNSKA